MDYPLQRFELYKVLVTLVQNIQLDEGFVEGLEREFRVPMELIKGYPDELKKFFILLELTKRRDSCNEVIKLLLEETTDEDSRKLNKYLAEELQKINVSPGRNRDYTDDAEIPVTEVDTLLRSGPNTTVYPMTKKPRGRAIIINNVTDLVQRESARFKHVFEKLFFFVETWSNLTRIEILHKMINLREKINQDDNEKGYQPDGLIVMVISHGEDDKILGINAIDNQDQNDLVNFHEITDVFANFDFTANFPRMFFFNCCRIITEASSDNTNKACLLKSDYDSNSNTVIVTACAQGYETFAEQNHLYTVFGKCLSESIAQYAHMDDLTKIIIRTISELRQQYEETGYFAPEMNIKALKRGIYFNPGWFDNLELFESLYEK